MSEELFTEEKGQAILQRLAIIQERVERGGSVMGSETTWMMLTLGKLMAERIRLAGSEQILRRRVADLEQGQGLLPLRSDAIAAARLMGLIELGGREDSQGNWRVTLDYDNYQDGARVLDGDGRVLGECYEDLAPGEDGEVFVPLQFLAAIDAAIANAAKSETTPKISTHQPTIEKP